MNIALYFIISGLAEIIVTLGIMIALADKIDIVQNSVILQLSMRFILAGLEIVILCELYRINKKYSNVLENKSMCYLFVGSFLVYFIMFRSLENSATRQPTVNSFAIAVIVILYEVAIMIYFAWHITEYKRKETKYLETISFTQKQLSMYNDIEQKIEKSRKLFHDSNNHLTMIKILIEQNNIKEASKYIDSLIPEIKKCECLICLDQHLM